MQTVPQNSTTGVIPTDTDFQIVTAVLESGNSVELPAVGYSMFPTLRPGDRVLVRPLNQGEIPVPGSVVVFINKDTGGLRENGKTGHENNGTTAQRQNGVRTQGHKNRLVLHRLIKIINDEGSLMFITRGDSSALPDKSLSQEQLIGVAVSYKSGEKKYSVKTFIPGSWRYGFNHRLLWAFTRILRLFNKLRI